MPRNRRRLTVRPEAGSQRHPSSTRSAGALRLTPNSALPFVIRASSWISTLVIRHSSFPSAAAQF